MNWLKQALDFAVKANVPEILANTKALIHEIKTAVEKAPDIMSSADKAALDQIHVDAMTASEELDAAIDAKLNG